MYGNSVERTLRRGSGEVPSEVVDESDALRSAFSLGASGIAGTVVSPKTLWLWDEYF